jgi:hypothetical protein
VAEDRQFLTILTAEMLAKCITDLHNMPFEYSVKKVQR